MSRFLKDFYPHALVILSLVAVKVLTGGGILPWFPATPLDLTETLLGLAVLILFTLYLNEWRTRTEAEGTITSLNRTDDLTGLPNRLAVREAYDREWKHAQRTQAPLSVLHVDVDLFKGYNDLYGHAEADDLLKIIGDAVKSQMRRPRDFAGRYDGEEFIGVLPDTDAAGALAVAENIRKAVMERSVFHKRSHHGVVTVSVGVATTRPTKEAQQDSLFQEADEALARAKSSGRNRVCLAGQEEAAATEVASA